MTAQIRPNRMEVSDRFPMLGFAVRVDQPNVEAQVVLATDVTLFDGANKPRRTAANFYCSDEQGRLSVPRGDGVFVVPPEVLARFIGAQKLYFGLATGVGGLSVDALPREGSPYVALNSFTGRSLRRSYTASRTAPVLEWAGDVPTPGSRPATPAAPAPVTTPPAPGGGGTYDDGFGPMPDIPAKAAGLARSGPMSAGSRGQVALNMSSGLSANDALAWLMEKVRGAAAAAGSDVNPPSLYRFGAASSTFVAAWQAGFGITGLINPLNAFLAALPQLAARSGVTISVGPALDTPVFGAGIGAVFAPDGQAALFGTADSSFDAQGISDFIEHLKLALQAKFKLGYNRLGIDGFASLRKVAAINAGEELVVGAELWLDGADQGLGGAVSIGAGFALQFGQEAAAYVPPSLPGTGARDRATRIGGQFATRIGEALDLGLAETTLTPLFEKLEGSARPAPMAYARAQAASRSINWDGVDWIAQPTDNGCWATTLAMLIGWKDQQCYEPAGIAQRCGRDINQGLPWDQRATVAAALGLGTLQPQCYTPEGFFSLIERHGPLYVGKMASSTNLSGHAVLVVGMYEDGGQYYVRVVDPWDRSVGTPGAPGAYASTHDRGSRYILRYEDFAQEYEMAADGTPAYVQIIYAGIPAGRQPNTGTSAPAGFAMAAPRTSSAMSAPDWSINWDGVQLVAQPTDNGCWATTIAMMLGWRDERSITPQSIAQRAGHDIEQGLPWDDHASTAARLGLTAHPPQCYSTDGFAQLIQNHGPLYVSKMATASGLSGHAVLVVGMYSSGGQYFVRIADPWDRPVGTPGKPGAYPDSHDHGSRYIMRYEAFQAEYEMAASGSNPVNVQILSAGVPAGRQINSGTTPPAGYAMAAPRTSSAMSAPDWSINWDNVQLVAQPTDNGCWATTIAMMLGWRNQQSITPESIGARCGRNIENILPWVDHAATAVQLGLTAHAPQCYSTDGFAQLIENHGPLYVGKMASSADRSGHAVLVVGMYSSGGQYYVRVADPWDRPVGTPGNPGRHTATHDHGSRYILRYEDFQTEYEMAATGNPANVQIFSAGVPAGRQINRTTTAPAGFAMAAPRTLPEPPVARSRALDIGAAATIAGTAVQIIAQNSGDIHTNLASWGGIKHPNDRAPSRSAAFLDGAIELRDWPVVGGTFGMDDIYCWLRIRWQYNGTSLGHIYIDDIGHDDAAGWGLTVNATIEDDARLYARSSHASAPGAAQVPALHINITYTFDEVIADDQVANSRITLYADGTHDIESRWVQHSRPGGGNPTNAPRPLALA
ncbi:hypothetical protein HNP52_001238 [Sphingomonas kyeonggiensis]|uniref:Papain like cysteine protease AvrRpt2 n=1 Tax=Sphingomonas kyeonggiensis TaxID=1268553 RepID=A0A7W7NRU7_9SPHN|nr:papain-like cysteine protease family protein [Sphingomonas kyeonggiensis]MBB4838187.1 hypothetical protein [Sphingomonas kyeonggiensis]